MQCWDLGGGVPNLKGEADPLLVQRKKPIADIDDGLSCGVSRGDRIRTYDPLLPKQVR